MNYDIPISELEIGNEFEGFYMISDIQNKTTANGKPYLSAVLADRSGSMELKVWDYTGELDASRNGTVVKVRAQVGEYRGTKQLTASRIRPADENDSFSEAALVPTAPIDREDAYSFIVGLVESIEDADYRKIAVRMLEKHGDTLRRIPAGKSIHHGFIGGLLMHTANMLSIADYMAGQYCEVIDRSLLLCGTLLHDLQKSREFSFSPLGLVNDYTPAGKLIGHLVLGAQELEKEAEALGVGGEKLMLLEHMLLSHHGEPDHGAALRPQIAEAELLHLIDMVDSRMEIYAENLQSLEPGQFSPRIYALDKRIYKPVRE